jgi:hypothetical protein
MFGGKLGRKSAASHDMGDGAGFKAAGRLIVKQAAELEARATQGPPVPSQPTVTHQQQQVQQQQSPEPVDPEKTKN